VQLFTDYEHLPLNVKNYKQSNAFIRCSYLPITNIFNGMTSVIEDRRRILDICYINCDTLLLQYKQFDNVVWCYFTHLHITKHVENVKRISKKHFTNTILIY
jgi:hypothetical protein